jgi:hypothetical protein
MRSISALHRALDLRHERIGERQDLLDLLGE